jgi:hypothetical protein
VRENENHRQVIQGRQAQRRTLVVREAEEGRRECAQPTVVSNAVGDRAHGMLTHPVVNVATLTSLAVEGARVGKLRVGRDRQIRIAADQPGDLARRC